MESSATAVTEDFGDLERHRRELTAHCYRMLGSPFEAEDAVQDTLLRAWRSLERFEGALVAALVAVPDRHERLPGHARLQAAPRAADGSRRGALAGRPDRRDPARDDVDRAGSRRPRRSPSSDPAAVAESRETIRLAFVAALQHLPPRQRAALILCEVLQWKAAEVAELLDTSVAAVNSSLQRARATLDSGRDRRPRPWLAAQSTTARCSAATSTPSSATTWTR